MKNIISIKNFSLFLVIFGLQACSSPKSTYRFPSEVNVSSCNKLLRSIMKINKSNVDNNQILMNQINKAIDVKITTKNSLDQLLQDKFYKDLIFNNESSANLESSALIVELIRKKNPYLSQTNVVKRYHLLFNTCGI